MFHTLSNIQRGEEVIPLLHTIDSRAKELYVGLKSIIYTVGWFNIEHETISWRPIGGTSITMNIPSGLYGFNHLRETLADISPDTHLLEIATVNGIVTLTVNNTQEILLSDGLLKLLGLSDDLNGCWLSEGEYKGICIANFTPQQVLHVHLNEIDTSKNSVNGIPSTLLSSIELGSPAFGDINTIRIKCPEYKRLRSDIISEFNVSIRDASGKIIDNHDLPIHITLAIK